MRENAYQRRIIKELERRLPGCFIMKMDANYRQGVPDILILHNDKWGFLEVKRSENEPRQPNQDYYVEMLNEMSFAAFIYPENEQEVLDALEFSLQPTRHARLSKR